MSQPAFNQISDALPLLRNMSEVTTDSTMEGELILELDCADSTNNSIECFNVSLFPDFPPNACICELAATQFTPEYATFNLILIVSILPAVAAFGVVTNALAFFVYTRSHMLKSTMNLYLAALALSDIFVDLCGISSIAIDSARRFDPLLNEIHLAIIPYTLPLCYIAQMCSVYFTVLAAFDCYLTVCPQNPQPTTLALNNRLRHRGFCASRNMSTKLYISTVVCICLIYNCITFFDLHVVDCVDYSHPETGNVLKKEICPTDLRLDPVYSQVYKVYMYAVFMTFLPFAILLTLNCAIIWKIYRISAEKAARRSRSDSIASDLNETRDEEPSGESTIMLVMVVALFLVCNSIALVVNIIETFGNYPMEDADAANRLFFVIDIGNFLVVFNSSANFLIYFAFSKAFRAVLTKKRRKLLGRLTSSFSSLNTQYYLASSSIKINEDIQGTQDEPQQQHHQQARKLPRTMVEAAAQAIAAIAVAVSLTPPTLMTPPMEPRFLNGTNAPTTKNSRGAYELLSVKCVSPTTMTSDEQTKRSSDEKKREKENSRFHLTLPNTA